MNVKINYSILYFLILIGFGMCIVYSQYKQPETKYKTITEPKILWAKYADTEWDGDGIREFRIVHYFLFIDKTLKVVSVNEYMKYNPNDTIYVTRKIPIE